MTCSQAQKIYGIFQFDVPLAWPHGIRRCWKFPCTCSSCALRVFALASRLTRSLAGSTGKCTFHMRQRWRYGVGCGWHTEWCIVAAMAAVIFTGILWRMFSHSVAIRRNNNFPCADINSRQRVENEKQRVQSINVGCLGGENSANIQYLWYVSMLWHDSWRGNEIMNLYV